MNKRLFVLLLLMTACLVEVSAQKYYPEGTTWTQGVLYFGFPQGNVSHSIVEGDTILNDKVYKKVTTHYFEGNENYTVCIYAIREEGDKIWVCYFDVGLTPNEEILVYDFDWEEGKNVISWYGWEDSGEPNIPAENIQLMKMNNGEEYEFFEFEDDYDIYKVVRSIGVLNGGELLPRYKPLDITVGRHNAKRHIAGRYILTSFVRNGVELYVNHEADEDGIDAVSEKPSNRKTQSPEIFDLQGRRLTDVTAKGVYILNGKKVVIGNN